MSVSEAESIHTTPRTTNPIVFSNALRSHVFVIHTESGSIYRFSVDRTDTGPRATILFGSLTGRHCPHPRPACLLGSRGSSGLEIGTLSEGSRAVFLLSPVVTGTLAADRLTTSRVVSAELVAPMSSAA